MKFVKKLVIMVGQSAKGTAAFERNAYGVTAAVNTYNLQNLKNGEYVFAVKCGDNFEVKTLERLSQKFEFNDMELDEIHCAVIYGDKCVMYGTNQSKRIWEGSFVDEALRKLTASRVSVPAVKHDANAQAVEYSPRPKIDDFFLDVLPKERYEDDAIAEVNYFSREPLFSRIPSPSVPARDLNIEDEFKLNVLNDDEASEFMNSLKDKGEESTIGKASQNPSQSVKGAHPNNKPNSETQCGNNFMDKNTSDVFNKILDKTQVNGEVKTNAFRDDKPRTLKNYATTPSDMERSYIKAFLNGCAFCEIEKFEKAKNSQAANRNERGTNGAPADSYASKPYGGNLNGAYDTDYANRNERGTNGSSADSYAVRPHGDNSNTTFQSGNFDRNIERDYSNVSSVDSYANRLSDAKKSGDRPRVTKVPELAKIMADEAAATAPPINKEMPNLRSLTFYEQVENQLKDLFDKNPREQNLEKLMPDTKWVKVDFDGKGRFYVVGIINKDFICYGVPAKYTPQPPSELDGYCQWLPNNPQKPQDSGYWLMFQDAVTGESVKKDVV